MGDLCRLSGTDGVFFGNKGPKGIQLPLNPYLCSMFAAPIVAIDPRHL
jgi:hypothetical protein